METINGNCYPVIVDMKKEHIPFIAETEKQNFSEPWSETSISESANRSTAFFVAEIGGIPVGYVGLNYVLDEGYITSIAVVKEYRKRGIGERLLCRCFEFAKDKKLSFISLEVRQSNKAAISLYDRLDFKYEGLRKGFYQMPREDAIIMTRRF